MYFFFFAARFNKDDRALYHSLQKMGGTAAGTPKVENVSPVCPSSPASSDSERLQHLTGSHSSSRIRKRQLPPPSARDNKGFITKIVAAANLDVDSDHRMHVLGTAGSAGEERIIEEDVEFTIDKEIEEYDFQSLICSSVNPIRRFACPYCAGR